MSVTLFDALDGYDMVRSAKKRLRIGEIPVDEPARIAGQRKLQMFRWGMAYLLQVFRELYHWR